MKVVNYCLSNKLLIYDANDDDVDNDNGGVEYNNNQEAVLSIDNREDDILDHQTSKQSTELLLQKTMSAFAFALENAATENYYSNQSDIPPDSARLLLCLNNCKYTVAKVGSRQAFSNSVLRCYL